MLASNNKEGKGARGYAQRPQRHVWRRGFGTPPIPQADGACQGMGLAPEVYFAILLDRIFSSVFYVCSFVRPSSRTCCTIRNAKNEDVKGQYQNENEKLKNTKSRRMHSGGQGDNVPWE